MCYYVNNCVLLAHATDKKFLICFVTDSGHHEGETSDRGTARSGLYAGWFNCTKLQPVPARSPYFKLLPMPLNVTHS